MTQQMSSKTLLSQFAQPTRRVSFLDEFMRVGDRAYGKLNTGVSKLSSYGSPGYSRQSPLDTVEYFGKISASKGANIDKEKINIPVKKQDAVNKFYQNNNPGNIKKGTFGGQTWGGDTYEGKKTGISYRKYNSKEEGLVDIINVMKNYKTNDLKRIINKYAQNDKSGKVYKNYYDDIKKVIGSDKIDFNNNSQIKNLMKVITVTENKDNSVPPGLYYKEKDFDKAISLYNKINESQIVPERKFQMNEGGSVKKQMAEVLNEDAPKGERLAYINSQEEKMLRDAGGSGELTESGIPSYRGHHGGGGGGSSSSGSGSRGPGGAGGRSKKGGNKKGKDKQGQTPGGPGKGRTTNTKSRGSLRDSGMVQGSSGYGPAGAGGQALGPSGNQGGNQGGNQTTTTTTTAEPPTTTAEPPTFGPTYETPEYTPYQPKTILDSFLDTYDDFTTFDTPLGEAKINLGLDSAGVSLSFKRGGLLDRSSKK
jgi:hypothetical protein